MLQRLRSFYGSLTESSDIIATLRVNNPAGAMEKISVIGGAGFIGTALCRLLVQAGLPFEIIDLVPSHSFPQMSRLADIRDSSALAGALSGQVIVHLAAAHRDDLPDPTEYQRTNVEGTRNICDLAALRGIGQIVFTSSVAVYGAAAPQTDETGPVAPTTPYGHSKAQAEEALRDWQTTTGGALTIIRPSVVFGEGNRGNVHRLLAQIAANDFVMVGSGENAKSMAYVGNVAAFLLECLGHKTPLTLCNYADGPDMTMAELVAYARQQLLGRAGTGPRISYGLAMQLGRLADRLAKLTGRGQPVNTARIEKFCAETTFANAAVQPRFEPQFTLKEGLDRMIAAEFSAQRQDGFVLAAE